jgi:hypothetical protein
MKTHLVRLCRKTSSGNNETQNRCEQEPLMPEEIAAGGPMRVRELRRNGEIKIYWREKILDLTDTRARTTNPKKIKSQTEENDDRGDQVRSKNRKSKSGSTESCAVTTVVAKPKSCACN